MLIKRNFYTYLIVVIMSCFFLLSAYIAYNNTQSQRFGDEVAHWVGGHYVLQGKELYKDLQFNHQPLNYYFSAIVETASSPNNLYLFISRQRFAVFAYGVAWDIIFLIFFGVITVPIIFIFEIGKYWFSGYKLLGETLAAYPLIFITGVFIESLFFKKKLYKLKLILLSISSFVAGFSLLPLWVVIVPMNALIFFHAKDKKNALIYMVVPFLLLTGTLFIFISPFNLLKETYIYNTQYFLPATVKFRPSVSHILLFPFFSLIPPYGPSKIAVAILFVGFLVSGYICIKYKKGIYWLLLLLAIIGTNFFRVGDMVFSSFHLLPWFGLILTAEIMLTSYLYNQIKVVMVKTVLQIKFFVYIIIFIYAIFSLNHIWKKKDLANEFYVNYSESEKYGRAIKVLKKAQDKLLVVPNDPLIYWVADIDTATRILEFYPWFYPIPEYKDEVTKVFTYDPPAFVVDTGIDLEKNLERYIATNLKEKYIRIYHLGEPSRLYISKNSISHISDEQWKLLEDMLFEKP